MIRRVPIVTIAIGIGIADSRARSFFHSAEALTVAAELAEEAKTGGSSAWRELARRG